MPTWIRVRDTSTGHEYDAREDATATLAPGVEPIEGYPVHAGPSARPRPAKPRVGKGGKPVTKSVPAAQGAGKPEGES